MGLLVKTFLLLLAARVALRCVPVRRIIAWKQRPVTPDVKLNPMRESEQRQLVRWAVLVAVRYSPLEFVCFPQCLAASALLRGRGIKSRLHYGVTREQDKLVTHTWLEAGGETLIGGEVSDAFSTLAVY